jgi:hypothetical protein
VNLLHDRRGFQEAEPATSESLGDERREKPRAGERSDEFTRIAAFAIELAPIFAGKFSAQRPHRRADRRNIVLASFSCGHDGKVSRIETLY